MLEGRKRRKPAFTAEILQGNYTHLAMHTCIHHINIKYKRKDRLKGNSQTSTLP